MRSSKTNEHDVTTAAIAALGWVLSDDARAQRFLALTGFEPGGLRARIADPEVHEAVRLFLEGFQPDLIACATAIGVPPEVLLPEPKENWA